MYKLRKGYLKVVFVFLIALFSSVKSNAAIYIIGGSLQTFDIFNTASGVLEPVNPPGSNFTMFAPVAAGIGKILANPDTPKEYAFAGTTEDVVGAMDDAHICFDISCTDIAMTFSSVTNFSGVQWVAHDIRVFGSGTYNFDTCLADGSTTCLPGDPTSIATLEVGPGQVGAQVYFDWGVNSNIDIFLLWQPNAEFTRPEVFPGIVPADTRIYELASRDVDGDGNAGSAMLDGPFGDHNASFSLFLDRPVAVPEKPCMEVTQKHNLDSSSGAIDSKGHKITINTCIDASHNLVFDWNVANGPEFADGSPMYPATDAAVIEASKNETTSPVLVFKSNKFEVGSTVTVSVRITNTDNGLSNGAAVSLLVVD